MKHARILSEGDGETLEATALLEGRGWLDISDGTRMRPTSEGCVAFLKGIARSEVVRTAVHELAFDERGLVKIAQGLVLSTLLAFSLEAAGLELLDAVQEGELSGDEMGRVSEALRAYTGGVPDPGLASLQAWVSDLAAAGARA